MVGTVKSCGIWEKGENQNNVTEEYGRKKKLMAKEKMGYGGRPLGDGGRKYSLEGWRRKECHSMKS